MDTKVIKIGHGRGSHYQKSHPVNQRPPTGGPGASRSRGPRPPTEIARVFNGDHEHFVGTLPVKLLVRFSRAAAMVFPRPETLKTNNSAEAVGEKGAATHSAPAEQQDQAIEHAETASAPATTSASASAPRPPKAAVPRTIYREIVITLQAFVSPTQWGVETTLDWMRRNSDKGRDQTLESLGGPDLAAVPDVDLLDLYQCALAFQLRPFPQAVRTALLARMSAPRPNLETMVLLNQCLPLRDIVTEHMMRAHYRSYMAREYSQADVDAMNEWLYDPPNRQFFARLEWVGRQLRREMRGVGSARNTPRGGQQQHRQS